MEDMSPENDTMALPVWIDNGCQKTVPCSKPDNQRAVLISQRLDLLL